MGNYIICPYYKKDHKRSITCEDTIRLYPSPERKSEVLKRLCSSSWKTCPYALTMEEIYSSSDDSEDIKEKLMENKTEQMEKEINKLMRENGQLTKKIEVLKKQLDDRDRSAEKNHRMYMKNIQSASKEIDQLKENLDNKIKENSEKLRLLSDKDELIKWLESFAAAFLVVAYGDDTREVRMPQDKVLKLMTEFSLEQKFDTENDCWIFNINRTDNKTN